MTSAPIDILFAIPELDRGGPDRVMFEVIRGLDRRQFNPSLMVCVSTGDYLSRLPPDIHVEVIGAQRTLRGRYPVWSALRYIRKTRPHVVFATQRMILTLGSVAAALPRDTKLVMRQANDVTADFAALVETSLIKHRLARRLVLETLKRADAVVCQSEAMLRDLRALLPGAHNLHVIGNPVDLDGVDRTVEATRVELRGKPALVSVGRLVPQKGFDIVLPAIAQVRASVPDVHLTVFGDGPARTHLETTVRELALTDNVTFAGFTSEPLPYLRAADLFVLASRYEGFPNAALEALACGTPVVLTDCPGANSEIVSSGKNGRLARGVASDAMAEAILAAIDELPRYDRAQIRADCGARFSAPRIIGAYEAMFAAVARGAA